MVISPPVTVWRAGAVAGNELQAPAPGIPGPPGISGAMLIEPLHEGIDVCRGARFPIDALTKFTCQKRHLLDDGCIL